MTDTIKRELKTITNAITDNTEAVAIYLFGSYAYGEPHGDSDLDIYAVFPDTDVDTQAINAYSTKHHDYSA
jgi:predicted nucleotidyltransferase